MTQKSRMYRYIERNRKNRVENYFSKRTKSYYCMHIIYPTRGPKKASRISLEKGRTFDNDLYKTRW